MSCYTYSTYPPFFPHYPQHVVDNFWNNLHVRKQTGKVSKARGAPRSAALPYVVDKSGRARYRSRRIGTSPEPVNFSQNPSEETSRSNSSILWRASSLKVPHSSHPATNYLGSESQGLSLDGPLGSDEPHSLLGPWRPLIPLLFEKVEEKKDHEGGAGDEERHRRP